MADPDTPVLEATERNTDAEVPASHNRGNFTRNLNVEPDEAIAKKMFFGGLLLLPWLHAVNIIFYRKQFVDPSINPKVTLWVRRSCMSFAFMTVLFIAWVILFQLKWKDFGWANLVMVLPAEHLDEGW
uniref:Gamma-secretase subunit PEN-2 n=1 Tax=Globisporangium ultimum (strain ATCC 200006 / CBS 805.95 / DAOM BR144) TaxID=431595 RepID=K3XB54_GLOUD